MLVLGINAHHADAAAALYADGRLVAAVAEERLNRIKHCAGFPALAVAEVLRIGGASLTDVDEIGIARDSRANLVAKAGYVLKHLGGIGKVAKKRLKERAGLAGLEEQLCEAMGAPRSKLRAKVRRVEHHVSHAASAFLCSPFERAAVLTLDGFGDFASCLAATGEGSKLKPLWRVTYPHSLGILYTAMCQFIGYDRYGDEGKVMGLAPYGEPRFAAFFEKLLKLKAGGRTETEEHPVTAERFVYVLCGEIEVRVDDKLTHLRAGESLYFNADRPHQIRNAARSESRLLSIMTPTSL